MHTIARLCAFGTIANRLPQPQQKVQVGFEGCRVGALARGACDHAVLRRVNLHQRLQPVAQARAFGLVFDTRRDADDAGAAFVRQQHQVTRGQRQHRGQPCAFAAERVLHHLHQHVLPFAQQLINRRHGYGLVIQRVGQPRQARLEHVAGVQKRRALQTDLDEGGLHARQHALDTPLVDIADQAVTRRALDIHLLHAAAFDQRDPGFVGTEVDQDFTAHRAQCQAPPAKRMAHRPHGW